MTRYLLLQVRDAEDRTRRQEVACFAAALDCDASQIQVHDLLSGAPTAECFEAVDVVLLGGSGDYSVAEGGPWLAPALAAMRILYETSKPTFASCWGFQAMAKALGGEVVTDIARAELGAVQVELTQAGREDPLFAPLGNRFLAWMGHQDCVTRLPEDAILLASSEKVENQAFRFRDKPIYCTQFHPELNRRAILERLRAYPAYVERISRMSFAQFEETCQTETRVANALLGRFAESLSQRAR